eukprot:CAMPEP_0115244558 /NCGR_PEP_ID=MMETSP0270-20121206/40046_1 /TAXON_ID=71861 /ORGANISM="Scrippsiella trochoidea, Strain CCMP3099" /LENGTH=829 /DNA_ID=CAMNT_0002659691 /DNA_START=6 /DNA_END=2493 /DNA_ORIENTATION=+
MATGGMVQNSANKTLASANQQGNGATQLPHTAAVPVPPSQQPTNGGCGGSAQKVVGPNVQGTREEYQLVRRLQTALFGGVYEARGMSSGRDYAIKVLHKSELTKAQETSSIEFCEVPLSEIRFAELMRGHENVMEPEEHFEDMYCFYVVFDLCRGGDLLEALKQKRYGFDELQAQSLIKQATKGLAYLHNRRVAMQDVSLENMLLHIDESTGNYKVKICDPGQAAIFEVDQHGEEMQVGFHGLVGKSFRPPELHKQKPYHATKVDSWCLGWSTFYLLTAQPLFMSADPAQQDADWLLFQSGDYTTLFQQKSNLCSHTGLDFIFRLMQLEPGRRMSVTDALDHAWLTDPKICPVLAPRELLPEGLLKTQRPPSENTKPVTKDLQQSDDKEREQGKLISNGPTNLPVVGTSDETQVSTGVSINWSASVAAPAVDLPTWAGAGAASPTHQIRSTPLLRVQSPVRSPRATTAATGVPAAASDRGRARGRQMQVQGTAARLPYVVATAHSPAPAGAMPVSPVRRIQASAAVRGVSPAQGLSESFQQKPQIQHQVQRVQQTATPLPQQQRPHPSVVQQASPQDSTQSFQQPAFMTPRMASRPRSPTTKPEHEAGGVPSAAKAQSMPNNDTIRQPAWAFKAERMGSDDGGNQDQHGRSLRTLSPQPGLAAAVPRVVNAGTAPGSSGAHVRYVPSPTRGQQSAVYVPRSPSPMQVPTVQMAARPAGQVRTASPVAAASRTGGFTWTPIPATFSPRGGQAGGGAMSRTTSPMASSVPAPVGFSFTPTPDPPSPRLETRTMSPTPSGAITFPTKGIAVAGGVRPSVVVADDPLLEWLHN